MSGYPLVFLLRFMSKSKKSASQAPIKQGPIFQDKNGNIVMQVLAKPGAKSNSVLGIEEDGVGIQIHARPVDGEANTELVKYVSLIFGLKKNEISLDRGMKSRQKVLILSKKDFTPENVMEKLKEEMNK